MRSRLDFDALEDCLESLKHLSIDINRLVAKEGYEVKRGGYGDVQVKILDGSKLVAAKTIYLKARHLKEPERLVFRLARELKVWARLNHPHVLPVLGYYLDEDRKMAVLMSEFMIYGDLKDYIEQEEPTWEIRLYLIRDATAGLVYLHGQNPPIRHGDLKMGNVLINAERRAILADFGLSKALEEGPSGLTTSDSLKGTIRYLSPELMRVEVADRDAIRESADRDAWYTLQSDIWGWACLALEVLADTIPYATRQFQPSIIYALMQNEPPADTKSLPIPAPAVKHLLERCWKIDPNERPSAEHCLSTISTESSALWNAERQMQFHEFFTDTFNNWLSQRRLMLDPPRVNGKVVNLHKLFLMVGALGGCGAVFEKKLWPVVGAKIGFPYFNGTIPHSKPEVAEQLSKIYQEILADFEVHWHNSLRLRDPNSIFPLPQQLQDFHPEIERLATAQFPLPESQQPQRPLGAGPQQPPDGNARGGTPNQVAQQTPQMGHAQAATQQQEAIMRNQAGLAFPSQLGPSRQGAAMAGELSNLPPQPPPLQQLFDNPEVMELSPEELKRRGISDDIIQTVMMYPQAWVAETIQSRREQELQLQQGQIQAHQAQQAAQQAASLLNSKKETPQMAPGNRLPSGLGGAQPPGFGPAVGNSLQPSAFSPQPGAPQLPATVADLNVSLEQLAKAQEKVRAAIDLFHNKRNYSSINLSHEQEILLEQSIQQTPSLLKQVAQNLAAFVVLAPNDERELNQVAQAVVTLSDQARILQQQLPDRQFIFGLDDLNQYTCQLTTFLARIKELQSQAMALQSQLAPGALPPGPPPKPPATNSKFAIGKKPVPKLNIPPERETTKPTTKISSAEVSGISQPEPKRPQSSKREREDDVIGPDGSAGPSGLLKRVRTDPQEDLDTKRATDLADAKQLPIEGSLDYLDKTTKEYEKGANAPATTAENGAAEQNAAAGPTFKALLQMLGQGALQDHSAAKLPGAIPGLAAAPSQDAPASGVKEMIDYGLLVPPNGQPKTKLLAKLPN